MCNLYLWDVTFVIVRCDICICVVDTQPTYTGHHAPASRRCVLHNETQTVTVEYPWWWSCWFWSFSLADSRTSSFFVQYQQKKWYVCRIFWMNFCFQTERLWENKWLTKPSNWESANPLQNCVPRPLIPLFRNSLYSRSVSVFSTPLYFFIQTSYFCQIFARSLCPWLLISPAVFFDLHQPEFHRHGAKSC